MSLIDDDNLDTGYWETYGHSPDDNRYEDGFDKKGNPTSILKTNINKTMEEQKVETIKIASVEDVGWGVKIKSENGMTFNIPKTLKDSTEETKAWQVLKDLQGYGMGMTKTLKYVETPNKQGGTSRYVRMIMGDGMSVLNGMSIQKVETPAQPFKMQTRPAQSLTRDFEAENRGKVRYGFALEAFKAGKVLDIKLVDEIKKWVDYTMSGELYNFTKEPMNIPVAEPEEPEILVENIPF
jgi:hypothetical protein